MFSVVNNINNAVLYLWYLCGDFWSDSSTISDMSGPVGRKQARNLILAPTTTTSEAFKERNIVNNYIFSDDLVYLLLGAGVTALVFVLVIIMLLILLLINRLVGWWIDSMSFLLSLETVWGPRGTLNVHGSIVKIPSISP